MKKKDIFNRIKKRIYERIEHFENLNEFKITNGLEIALDIFEQEEAELKKVLYSEMKKIKKSL
jgi:hypothetical protein